MKKFWISGALALSLMTGAFAEGTITWCDSFKVKHKDHPTDAVSYAQGPGPVHAGDTYKLGSVTGNRLFFWVEYNPPLKLTGENQIRVVWTQIKDDGTEMEMQNQEIGGLEPVHQAYSFIPYAVPGKFVMKIVLMPGAQVIAKPRTINITQ